MDGFVEYQYDKGWWFGLFLKIGEFVSKFPEYKAQNGDTFINALANEIGVHDGQNDTRQKRMDL